MEDITVIHSRHRDSCDMYTFHAHDEYEIYYMLSGRRRLVVGQDEYDVGEGDMVVLSPGMRHKCVGIGESAPYEKITVYVSPDTLSAGFAPHDYASDEMYPESPCVQIPTVYKDHIKALFVGIEREYNCGARFWQTAVRGMISEIMVVALRSGMADSDDAVCRDNAISRAIEFISANYTRPITLYDAAEYTGLSANWFSKKFKAVTGVGFKEYIIRLRIDHATMLLLNTNMTVTDIAYNCGFDSSNYFGDAFKRIKGMSPGRFRKEIHRK